MAKHLRVAGERDEAMRRSKHRWKARDYMIDWGSEKLKVRGHVIDGVVGVRFSRKDSGGYRRNWRIEHLASGHLAGSAHTRKAAMRAARMLVEKLTRAELRSTDRLPKAHHKAKRITLVVEGYSCCQEHST